jgi:hypothetical protein
MRGVRAVALLGRRRSPSIARRRKFRWKRPAKGLDRGRRRTKSAPLTAARLRKPMPPSDEGFAFALTVRRLGVRPREGRLASEEVRRLESVGEMAPCGACRRKRAPANAFSAVRACEEPPKAASWS